MGGDKKEKASCFLNIQSSKRVFGIMGLNIAMCNVFLVGLVVLLSSWDSCEASVSYDSTAITVNGQRKILISGSIHYPRSTPEVYLSQMCSYFFSEFRANGNFSSFYGFSFVNCVFSYIIFLGTADVARSYSEG